MLSILNWQNCTDCRCIVSPLSSGFLNHPYLLDSENQPNSQNSQSNISTFSYEGYLVVPHHTLYSISYAAYCILYLCRQIFSFHWTGSNKCGAKDQLNFCDKLSKPISYLSPQFDVHQRSKVIQNTFSPSQMRPTRGPGAEITGEVRRHVSDKQWVCIFNQSLNFFQKLDRFSGSPPWMCDDDHDDQRVGEHNVHDGQDDDQPEWSAVVHDDQRVGERVQGCKEKTEAHIPGERKWYCWTLNLNNS